MIMTIEAFLLIFLAIVVVAVVGILPYLLMLVFKYVLRLNRQCAQFEGVKYYLLMTEDN